MKLGYFCLASGVVSLFATVWMLVNGTVFVHGFVVFFFLTLFGLYLISRNRKLDAIRRWARSNPEDAQQWLNHFEEANNNAKK